MTMTERRTVICVVDSRETAERAMEELRRNGFTDDQIGFAMRGGEAHEGGHDATGGTVAGAIAGLGIGGVAGAVAAGLIPGIGPVIAGGLLAGIIGGGVAGAVAGGILGWLTEQGIPEEEARYYNREFEAGRAIITVQAGSRNMEARRILSRFGSTDVTPGMPDRDTDYHRSDMTGGMSGGSAGYQSGTAGTMAGSTREMGSTGNIQTADMGSGVVRGTERGLSGGLGAGGIDATRTGLTENRSTGMGAMSAGVHGADSSAGGTATGGTMTGNTVTGGTATGQGLAGTHPAGVSQSMGGTTATGREGLMGTPGTSIQEGHRDTGATSGSMTGTGGGSRPDWQARMPYYRDRWQSRYGASGQHRWEDWEPGYRYGYEMARDPRFQGKRWTEIEHDLQRHYNEWASRHGLSSRPDSGWDRVREATREAWDEEFMPSAGPTNRG